MNPIIYRNESGQIHRDNDLPAMEWSDGSGSGLLTDNGIAMADFRRVNGLMDKRSGGSMGKGIAMEVFRQLNGNWYLI